MSEPEWLPITTVRGHGMMIRGKRIGLYNMMRNPEHHTHWAVFYLILTRDEWKICWMQFENAPFAVSYVDIMQPECATVTRSYLAARREIYGSEDLMWIGCYLPYRDSPYTHQEVQGAVLQLNEWAEACIGS